MLNYTKPVVQILFCTENSVACVAETRNDVVVVIKLFINGAAVNINVRTSLVYILDTLRGCDDAHKLDVLDACLL